MYINSSTFPLIKLLQIFDLSPQDEWDGNDFGLNFGVRINFVHKPIQMYRDEENVLVGEYSC